MTVQPALVSALMTSASASGSVRTAVTRLSGQTRCTAIVPSLLESARTYEAAACAMIVRRVATSGGW